VVGLITKKTAQWAGHSVSVWTTLDVPREVREWALEHLGTAEELLLAASQDAEFHVPADVMCRGLSEDLRRMEAAMQIHDMQDCDMKEQVNALRECARYAGVEEKE
jgi:hypothetical protein